MSCRKMSNIYTIYYKRRNFRPKKLLRFRGFLPYSRKFLPRNFSKSLIRESLFPQKFINLQSTKVNSREFFFKISDLTFFC